MLTAVVTVGLAHAGHTMGLADLVTLGRGLMACAVAALTVELLLGHQVTPVVLALTVPALALDAVDGRVARRTGTVTAFGGRFDGEVDAFLILVLSVAAAPTVGWWVLAAGLARYAFAVAGWWLPWMRAALEFRYWRKVVTATVGIVLAVAVADVLPDGLTMASCWSRWACSPSRSAATCGGSGATGARRRRPPGPPASGGVDWPSRPPCWPWGWCGSRSWPRPGPTGSPPAPSCGFRWKPWSSRRSPWWCPPARRVP